MAQAVVTLRGFWSSVRTCFMNEAPAGVRQVGLACEFADPVHLPGLSAVGREDWFIRADLGRG